MVLILGNKIENWMKFFISSVGTFPDLPPPTRLIIFYYFYYVIWQIQKYLFPNRLYLVGMACNCSGYKTKCSMVFDKSKAQFELKC